jgi:tRNA-dihydrouridine synthase 3
MKRHPSEDCFGVQVCGGFGDAMTRCAQLIEDVCHVDFVDINFGCPIDLICGKGAGSACLQRPNRMSEIVRGMSAMLSCPLTLKMRRGYNEGDDVAHKLVPQVALWGAAGCVIHGRTREQRYSRPADWEYIAQCAAAAPPGFQVVGNGDVLSFEDHARAVEGAGVATTYVARGALMKPWVFTEIKERRHWDISAGERLDLYRKFASHGLEHWGSDERGVETTRSVIITFFFFFHTTFFF